MLLYVDIIVLCHSVAILREIYVMRSKCHVKWLSLHFKRMLITGLGQKTLIAIAISTKNSNRAPKIISNFG